MIWYDIMFFCFSHCVLLLLEIITWQYYHCFNYSSSISLSSSDFILMWYNIWCLLFLTLCFLPFPLYDDNNYTWQCHYSFKFTFSVSLTSNVNILPNLRLLFRNISSFLGNACRSITKYHLQRWEQKQVLMKPPEHTQPGGILPCGVSWSHVKVKQGEGRKESIWGDKRRAIRTLSSRHFSE